MSNAVISTWDALDSLHLPHFSPVIKVQLVNRYQIVLILGAQIDVFIPVIYCFIVSYFA